MKEDEVAGMDRFHMEESIERVARDLVKSHYAIALTGAGISTESGIPDFRGPDGIWTKNPEAELEAYEAYQRFKENPKGYWEERLDPKGFMARLFSLLSEIEKARPNLGHYALAELGKIGIIKCVITQNVDGLHQKAGSHNVIEYHGGLNKFRCVQCNRRFKEDELDLEALKTEGRLPPQCSCGGVVKDDGVFFGEPIPSDVLQKSQREAWKCDLMLICGTSAVVYPFASLPEMANQSANIIEVNGEPTPLTGRISKYLVQGKTGEILPKIVDKVKQIQRT